MKIEYNGYEIEVIMLSVSGSRLYGNSTDESDYDYRGIFIADKVTKLGLIGKVEQISDPNFFRELDKKYNLGLKDFSDCLIYELNRFAELCADANPNIFDILCTPIDKCLYINDKGKELVNNRNLFLSSKLKFTFSGYAISQLTKIRNRDKYLTKYPHVSKVLNYIKSLYGKTIDWDWVCNNFGGIVAEYVSEFKENAQNHTSISKANYPTWEDFKFESGFEDLDRYRIPQLINYCTAKDLKNFKFNLDWYIDIKTGKLTRDNCKNSCKLSDFLYNHASFREFSPSMLAIYTDGNGIFTKEGKLKSAHPEHIGDFVCLLSIDQNNYKTDKDFNAAMWEWKCKRNEARSALEAEFGIDLKNVSHLWRLMTKAKEILNTGDYNPVLEGQELKDLKDIRSGVKWGQESYEKAIEFAERNDKELDELYKTTKLQKKPDIKKINDLVLKLQD